MRECGNIYMMGAVVLYKALLGIEMPERYGKNHPHQWLGYGRICQELEATELDSWAEYTLLKIDAGVDEEAILLLKMTVFSTQPNQKL